MKEWMFSTLFHFCYQVGYAWITITTRSEVPCFKDHGASWMKCTVIVTCCCSATSVSVVEEMNSATENIKPVVHTKNKRRKRKYSSRVDDEDSSDMLEQSASAITGPAAAGRYLRSRNSATSERAKKQHISSEVDDEDKDGDYEPEAVSRPKHRKNRRRWMEIMLKLT